MGTPGDPDQQAESPIVAPPARLEERYVRAVMQEQIAPLATQCYDLAVVAGQKDPNGVVFVGFQIVGDPDIGAVVTRSEVLDKRTTPSLLQTPVAECIMETLYAVELDPPPAGGVVNLAFPFEFGSENNGAM